MEGVIILGAGLAGLSFSYASGHKAPIYEQRPQGGGRCSTHEIRGFLFDEGPHISFTSHPLIQELLSQAVNGQYHQRQAEIWNYHYGRWLPHPVQTNLQGLPWAEKLKYVLGFMFRPAHLRPRDYGQWLLASLGDAMTQGFAYPYTRKYWTVEPEQLALDWVGERVHQPKLKEVLWGSWASKTNRHHYIQDFRYPIKGGFQSYTTLFSQDANIFTSHKVTGVSLERKRIDFADGREVYFDQLISTIPLPRLLGLIYNLPSAIQDLSEDLWHTSVGLVNLAFDQPLQAKGHWLYIYDQDLLPVRIHYPHLLAPQNAPQGCTSLQAEVYFSARAPRIYSPDQVVESTIRQLLKTRIITVQPLFSHYRELTYANIICNHRRPKGVHGIRDFLRTYGIHCLGRYGAWEYLWSDQTILAGFNLAQGFRNIAGKKEHAHE